MSNNCCDQNGYDSNDKYKVILWIVLLINLSMFVVEIIFSFSSNSQSLLADSLDFFSDTANYAISIYVLNKVIVTRAKAALFKGYCMFLLGTWVLVSTIYRIFSDISPQAETMGVIGVIALLANIFSAFLLYKYRKGDSNRTSVWICSRNDAIGNIAVIIAALGVGITDTKWPDLIVAGIIVTLSFSGSLQIIRQGRRDIREN